MNRHKNTSRRGVTLLELMAAIVVLSIIAGVVMPVIVSATDSYASARSVRSSTESLAYASDQLQRIVRKAPSSAGGENLGVTVATTTRVLFLNGTGFEFDGTDLNMLEPGGSMVPVCTNVDSFSIAYYANDGSTDMIATPTQAHRIGFKINKGGSTIAGMGFPRVWIGQDGP